jgi:hypothetical protein
MIKRTSLLACLLLAPLPGMADDIDQINALAQAQFRDLSEDLGAALSYKAVIPAEPLGLAGFDIGVVVTSTKLEHKEALEAAMSDGDAPSSIIVPKLHLHKGLPLGIDVGAFYSAVPGSNIKLTGFEVRYAIVDGGVAMPAIGLRATYSKLSGVDELKFKTQGLELTVSKGFAVVTPYAGVGTVKVTSTPVGDAASLDEEEFSQSKTYIGANFNLGLINFAIEADKTGDASTTTGKFGWRF